MVYLPCFVVGAGEDDLRTAALAQRGIVSGEGFRGEVPALREDVAVQVRQDGGIEADGVLHEQDHLHAHLADVMVDVHLVLHQLDDGQDEVGIAQPAENIVEDAQVFVLDALRDAVGERSQHHAVDAGELRFHGSRHVEGVVVGIARHADDEIYLHCGQHALGFVGCGHLRERRRIAKAELHVLVVDLLFHAPIVLEHEGIVGVGDNQDVVDAAHHQIDETDVLQIKIAPLRGNLLAHLQKLNFRQKYEINTRHPIFSLHK